VDHDGDHVARPVAADFAGKAKSSRLNFTAGAYDKPGPEPKPGLAVTTAQRPEFHDVIAEMALIFFLVSIVAAVFGFTGISLASADIARILFYIFLVIFLILLVLGLTIARRV
jgi:uncharacterized membrane protein YtjA (UPF0391 family)